MKHAKLAVGQEDFKKWLEAVTREKPLFLRMKDGLYYVRFSYQPEQLYSNACFNFIGIHEDKYYFEIDYIDELNDISYPQFPEDEYYGALNIVNVDDHNIDLYYYFLNTDFEKEVDLLLSSTPKSWDLEILSDSPVQDNLGNGVTSKENLILDLWNKNFPVKQIARELEKLNIYLSEKSIRNILTDLRKKLGDSKVPLRRKAN